jgi:hypothetical protein
MLLDIYLGKDRGCRCVASTGPFSVTASLSVDLRNDVHLCGVREVPLSEGRLRPGGWNVLSCSCSCLKAWRSP